MACRLTIDLSPPLSPALLPPEVYAELYRSYVSTYRAIGFALLGRTNTPKKPPASAPITPQETAPRTPRKTKPTPRTPLGDITPQASLWLSSGPPQTTSSVSYADVAASQTSPSPTVRSAKRSVKVTAPVSNTQPKPILVSTPARAVLGPPTPGNLDPSDDMHTDFDADMLDPVDLVSSPPIPNIGRASGTRSRGTVTIVAPQSGHKV